MEEYTSVAIIIGVCVLVLLIGTARRKSEIILNFALRAVMGCIAIYFINQFLMSQSLQVAVGINPFTFITSGTLGFPGLLLLYGINFYKLF